MSVNNYFCGYPIFLFIMDILYLSKHNHVQEIYKTDLLGCLKMYSRYITLQDIEIEDITGQRMEV